MAYYFWAKALQYTFPTDMTDPVYGGFIGAIKKLADRFKLNKPPTDIHQEAKKEIEINMMVDNNNIIANNIESNRNIIRNSSRYDIKNL
jgi:hypothetical protein